MSISSQNSRPSLQITSADGRALSPTPSSPRPSSRFLASTSAAAATPTKGSSWLYNQLNARPKPAGGIEHQSQHSLGSASGATGTAAAAAAAAGGLRPPGIEEEDEHHHEGGHPASSPGRHSISDRHQQQQHRHPSNASILSLSSSIDIASDEGPDNRQGTVRSMDAVRRPPSTSVPTRAASDHDGSNHGGRNNMDYPASITQQRKSDTLPRPRTSESYDRFGSNNNTNKDLSSSSTTPLTSLYLVSGTRV